MSSGLIVCKFMTSALMFFSARAACASSASATIAPHAMIVMSSPSLRTLALPISNSLSGVEITGTFSRPNRMYTGPSIFADCKIALRVSS